jgi:hypothetical protein
MHFQGNVRISSAEMMRSVNVFSKNPFGQLYIFEEPLACLQDNPSCCTEKAPHNNIEARRYSTFLSKRLFIICMYIASQEAYEKKSYCPSNWNNEHIHTEKAMTKGGMHKTMICNGLQMHTATNNIVAIWRKFRTTSISYQQASLIYFR